MVNSDDTRTTDTELYNTKIIGRGIENSEGIAFGIQCFQKRSGFSKQPETKIDDKIRWL